MPTNILRQKTEKTGRSPPRTASGQRDVVITAGRISIRARLANSPTADRIWAALPLFSAAETWGESLKFEIPIESGRERGARVIGKIGEIYFVAEEDRILIVYGRTPISRPNEIRLPRPCSVIALTDDDVGRLKVVTPGEKVSIERAETT